MKNTVLITALVFTAAGFGFLVHVDFRIAVGAMLLSIGSALRSTLPE